LAYVFHYYYWESTVILIAIPLYVICFLFSSPATFKMFSLTISDLQFFHNVHRDFFSLLLLGKKKPRPSFPYSWGVCLSSIPEYF
jgi:hypothetical protein